MCVVQFNQSPLPPPQCFFRSLDFLTERPQSVRIANRTSDTIMLNTGVPQGGVLSPLLFMLLTRACISKSVSLSISCFKSNTLCHMRCSVFRGQSCLSLITGRRSIIRVKVYTCKEKDKTVQSQMKQFLKQCVWCYAVPGCVCVKYLEAGVYLTETSACC